MNKLGNQRKGRFPHRDGDPTLVSPSVFLPEANERRDTYAMTDDVSNEDFEEVVRKVVEGS